MTLIVEQTYFIISWVSPGPKCQGAGIHQERVELSSLTSWIANSKKNFELIWWCKFPGVTVWKIESKCCAVLRLKVHVGVKHMSMCITDITLAHSSQPSVICFVSVLPSCSWIYTLGNRVKFRDMTGSHIYCFSCELCKEVFESKPLKTAHMNEKHYYYIFQCPKCEFATKDSKRLKEHIPKVSLGHKDNLIQF